MKRARPPPSVEASELFDHHHPRAPMMRLRSILALRDAGPARPQSDQRQDAIGGATTLNVLGRRSDQHALTEVT